MSLAVVLIGRNEGARLEASLASLQGRRIVYVDSGSTDNSVAAARAAGAEVVTLDPATPFTAARARHEGFQALGESPPDVVQFIDGDCSLVPGWIEEGLAALQDDPPLDWSPDGDPRSPPMPLSTTRFATTNGTARQAGLRPAAVT